MILYAYIYTYNHHDCAPPQHHDVAGASVLLHAALTHAGAARTQRSPHRHPNRGSTARASPRDNSKFRT
eukprot:5084651-Pyramimonas_sp.AAC.1